MFIHLLLHKCVVVVVVVVDIGIIYNFGKITVQEYFIGCQ